MQVILPQNEVFTTEHGHFFPIVSNSSKSPIKRKTRLLQSIVEKKHSIHSGRF